MGKTVDKSNLGYLGIDFQYKLVKYFIEDRNFFNEISNIVDQNAFTDTLLRIFVGTIKDYYNKENIVPSYSTIEIALRTKANDEIEIKEWEELINKLKNLSYEGNSLIKENALKFFRQQKLIKAANKMLEKVGKGDIDQFDECQKLIEDALQTDAIDDYGYSIFDLEEKALSADYTVSIPTGVDGLDAVLGGGLDKGKIGLIIGPLGFGKALPNSEKVLTPNGFVNMGELKVDDLVISAKGRPTKIIGVYPQGMRDIYKVEFSDGTSCRCDAEHLWNVNSLNQRNKKTHLKGKPIRIHDYTYKTMTLSEIMKEGIVKNGQKNFRIPIVKPVEFNENNVKIDPYLMGYFIGDGSFSNKRITCHNDDFSNLEKRLIESKEKYTIHEYNYKPNVKNISLTKEFMDRMLEYFLENKISADKFVPETYKYNSVANRIKLLNGLMDADGTVNKKSGNVTFNTKSKQLAEDVREIVLSLGGFVKITEKKCGYYNKKCDKKVDCGIQYELHFSLTDETINVFGLERKQKYVKYRTKYKLSKFISNITYVGKENATCIRVEDEDGLFLTNDYIVTHNSTLATAFASAAAAQGWKALQIYFEDDDVDITRKHFSRLTDTEACEFKRLDEHKKNEIIETISHHPDKDKLRENLRLKSFNTGEMTATDIKNFIVKLTNKGFKPDLVIIDYFECLAPERSSNRTESEWAKEGVTMRKLESMAKELDIAMWIPTQGNKDSIMAEVVTVDKSGGSIKKGQIAQVIISIARTNEDRENNRATLALLKNRSGKGSKLFKNIYFDNGKSTIRCDEVEEIDSLKELDEIEQEISCRNQVEMVRQLKQKQ